MVKNYKPKSAKCKIAGLKAFFNKIYRQKEIAETEYQLRCRIRDIAVIELLFATGMRISELCALKPDDIDFNSLKKYWFSEKALKRGLFKSVTTKFLKRIFQSAVTSL